MEKDNISIEEIQKSNLIIEAILKYYTKRIVGFCQYGSEYGEHVCESILKLLCQKRQNMKLK